MTAASSTNRLVRPQTTPRIGFLGVGWIGRHRMEAMLETGAVKAAAIADMSPEIASEAGKLAPGAWLATTLEELLELDLDGIVIATPSALHAAQSIKALEAGLAVFCQKPLGRTLTEVCDVVQAARTADRLLGVDMSYRHTRSMLAVRDLVQSGELGRIFAAELTFHNAYGPDKSWFYDKSQSGGGCVMDLGVHLVDLALWTLDFPPVSAVTSALYCQGELLRSGDERVEDYAAAVLGLETGVSVRLTCSWNLHAGRDAVISAEFHGTNGGVSFRNVNGSFYDFVAERHRGTEREILTEPPDPWGGRAAAEWAKRLAAGTGFDPEIAQLERVAGVLDNIYGLQGAGTDEVKR